MQCGIQSSTTSSIKLEKNNAPISILVHLNKNGIDSWPDLFFQRAWKMWSGNEWSTSTKKGKGLVYSIYKPCPAALHSAVQSHCSILSHDTLCHCFSSNGSLENGKRVLRYLFRYCRSCKNTFTILFGSVLTPCNRKFKSEIWLHHPANCMISSGTQLVYAVHQTLPFFCGSRSGLWDYTKISIVKTSTIHFRSVSVWTARQHAIALFHFCSTGNDKMWLQDTRRKVKAE